MGSKRVKVNKDFAKMFKNGVIMDVTNSKEAKIAEKAGACAVMALEKVPADIRKEGEVARMSDVKIIKEIMQTVSIPVMAKVRIGHFAEAMILESLGVDFIDESEVLTPADENDHIQKSEFSVPFVCGARNLGEALRRIEEGAVMIRTKGEAGTGNIVEAVKHMKTINREIKMLEGIDENLLKNKASNLGVSFELIKKVKKIKRLPVVNFAAGGVATPADAALMMLMGADGIFVGSGIFKSKEPRKMAEAIVNAVINYNNSDILAEISKDIGSPMTGLEMESLAVNLSTRGE
ncbi:MAG: pyridoxal 5'-phosphate synthase lyase subunit PdxS [Candidatus Mcinerneyibacterium aminivorans]|uniref:Pyridoxal 5'-phosphate synthase subunit PdxS n=1 Tax=Candidatus Mcinerneyibacterium aminivorans TaxID=2703815 RepID=A0A5D0MB92_9BACT|nr:MAG: pyridoxal 5'-phosphate synthase lyase subunit PdxS [Candidatus Mcinerneyibacterium aminivorans]